VNDAYDMIDRFLRNNLDDTDYAEYSKALDSLLPTTASAPEALNIEAVIRWIRDNYQEHTLASLCDGLRALAAPSTPAAQMDPQRPGWVQCPECLAGMPLKDLLGAQATPSTPAAEPINCAICSTPNLCNANGCADSALAAIRTQASDTDRLEWLMHRLPGSALRALNVNVASGGLHWARIAIDAAMKGSE
jgi:hypothetical protein